MSNPSEVREILTTRRTRVSGARRVPAVRIAVQIDQQHADYDELRDAALRAEDAGVDIVFNLDHFFPYSGDPEGKRFEALTMLASLAEATERVELGSLVSGIGYRNANLLADMARTIDHISGGRFILGLGAGWYERDYVEYGYDFPSTDERLRILRRDVPVIRSRLERLNPPPVRRMPILSGGEGERVTLRVVAEYADIWHTYATGDRLRRKSEVLDRWCAQVGRDPATLERATAVYGRPDRRVADELVRLGVSLFVIEYAHPPYDFIDLSAWLRWRDDRHGQA
jgi:probable F420-dependent oxidoreductase